MLRLGIILFFCLVLSSCIGWISGEKNSAKQYYPEPEFSVGDTFVFDNPYVRWQVVAVKDKKVHWVSDDGDLQITYVNPVLPVLVWKSPVNGKGRRLISGQIGRLFPMKVGNRASFRATVSTDRPPFDWVFNWSCDVLARVPVKGPKNKKYDTFKIKCTREKGDAFTFFYAPTVGHYIVMEASSNLGKPIIRRMVAYQRSGREMVGRIMTAASRGKAPALEQKIASSSPPKNFSALSDVRRSPHQSLVEPATASNGPAVIGHDFVLAAPPPRYKPVAPREQQSRLNTQPGAAIAAKRAPIKATAVSIPAAAEHDIRPITPNARVPTHVSARGGDNASALQDKLRRRWPISVHLASYSSQANAKRGWKQLLSRNADLLGALQPDLKKVNIQGRGTFFRLRGKPLPSRSAASELCRNLKVRGTYCRVIAP
ncbi:MAG: hypothetical protein CMM76_04360 [Rhodospirillaceae bacterium]|nr:hypothetical protein [Rhodospirillaceae bacterium]